MKDQARETERLRIIISLCTVLAGLALMVSAVLLVAMVVMSAAKNFRLFVQLALVSIGLGSCAFLGLLVSWKVLADVQVNVKPGFCMSLLGVVTPLVLLWYMVLSGAVIKPVADAYKPGMAGPEVLRRQDAEGDTK